MAVIDTYEVTLEDVNRILVWDVLTAENPPPAMVEDWLTEGATILQGTVGDIPVSGDPCGGDAFRTRARRCVALYAAAMAEDAHYPERTLDKEGGDQGSRLWNRWTLLSDALIVDIEKCRDKIVASGATGGSIHSFPALPFFTRTIGT